MEEKSMPDSSVGGSSLFENNEDNPICEVNVGDDDGIKEYPFITRPAEVKAMARLREAGKKELVLDFIKSAPYYDSCPKGSQLCKDVKLISIPGPYHSCPMLHEAGDDFRSLPTPQKRLPRPRTSMGFSRKHKKRPVCNKCSCFVFSHMDPEHYHQDYLSSYTYARMQNYHHPKVRSSGHSSAPDGENAGESGGDTSRLTDGMRPSGPFKGGVDVKNPKTIKPKRIKTPVQSRYLQVLRRRLNSTPTRIASPVAGEDPPASESRSADDIDASHNNSNPCPMPDVFEEIYFGDMSTSLHALPSQLQAFKKFQLRATNEARAVFNAFNPHATLATHGRLRHLAHRHERTGRSVSNLAAKKYALDKPAKDSKGSEGDGLKRGSKSNPSIAVVFNSKTVSLIARPAGKPKADTRVRKMKKVKTVGKTGRNRNRVLVLAPQPTKAVTGVIKTKGGEQTKKRIKKTKVRKGAKTNELTKKRRATISSLQEIRALAQGQGRNEADMSKLMLIFGQSVAKAVNDGKGDADDGLNVAEVTVAPVHKSGNRRRVRRHNKQ